MAEREQNYKNHVRWLPPFHFFLAPVLLVNTIIAGRGVYLSPSGQTAWELVVALALLTLGFLARTQALSAQDRVIRLEMRLRLKQILPADLHSKINTLSTRQLVALRFAGDGEMEGLVRELLSGQLAKDKDIKLRIKNWQADWQRV